LLEQSFEEHYSLLSIVEAASSEGNLVQFCHTCCAANWQCQIDKLCPKLAKLY
jgi:hypothetical protein